jgi:predicted DNA-binding ribbon-helix-helix protein
VSGDQPYDPGASWGDRKVEELEHIVEPMFKTVTDEDGRHGIRLERAFWDALEALSAQRGEKRGPAVAQIVARAQGQNINATSAVRSVTVDALRAENERLAAFSEPAQLISLLQLSPSPSFALDRRKRLVRANTEFIRYLRSIGGNLNDPAPIDTAQLSLDRPIEQIFAEVAVGSAIECGVSIRIANRERRSTARLLVVPPEPPTVIVGFILS